MFKDQSMQQKNRPLTSQGHDTSAVRLKLFGSKAKVMSFGDMRAANDCVGSCDRVMRNSRVAELEGIPKNVLAPNFLKEIPFKVHQGL